MGLDLKKFWYWIAGIVAAVAVVVTGGMLTAFFWDKVQNPTTASAASAIGSLLGAGVGLLSAIASAGAAVAAFMAAKKSDETAQRAGEALGLAMEPKLTAYINRTRLVEGLKPARDVVYLEVKNLSHWPAADVKIYATDRRFRPIGEIDYLPAAEQPNYTIKAKPGLWKADLTDTKVASGPNFGDLLIVDYSDERRILRWRQTLDNTNGLTSDVERLR